MGWVLRMGWWVLRTLVESGRTCGAFSSLSNAGGAGPSPHTARRRTSRRAEVI